MRKRQTSVLGIQHQTQRAMILRLVLQRMAMKSAIERMDLLAHSCLRAFWVTVESAIERMYQLAHSCLRVFWVTVKSAIERMYRLAHSCLRAFWVTDKVAPDCMEQQALFSWQER